ncbi:MAG: AAA family ATPase [Kiritimatiellae bacterium]|nr:AAA family ATPase [Kiritimatiellia bacterium]
MSYYRLLGFEKEPFSTSPDPSFFYLSREHKAALCRLQISIALRRGLSVVLGDVGIGKTTLSRKLSQELQSDKNIEFHMILNPYFKTGKQFLMRLSKMFHLDVPARATGMEYMDAIERYLFRRGIEEQKTIVLLIDESQILPDFVLEILRILLNYETNEYKILQLVLMGQLELLPRIRAINNFWDRIALKYVLNPLAEDEVRELIKFRIKQAGIAKVAGVDREFFLEEAIALIWEHSQGFPRKLALLCHDSLVHIFMHDQKVVDANVVKTVIAEHTEFEDTSLEDVITAVENSPIVDIDDLENELNR